MDKLKQWVALTVVAALGILAASWFLLVSPKRTEAADLRDQAASVDVATQALQTQLGVLKALAKDLPKAQADLAAVAAKVPDNPALPALIRSLTKAADSAGVELVSLAPSAPSPVTAERGAAPSAAGAAAGAAAGTGTLNSISVTLQVVGRYFAVEQFFDRLEGLSRAFKVTTFSMKPGTSPTAATVDGGTVPAVPETLTTSITGNVYLATGRQAAAAPAAAAK